MSKKVELRITRAVVVEGGVIAPAGSIVTVDATLAKDLLNRNRAELYGGDSEDEADAVPAGGDTKPAPRGRNAAKA